MIRLGVLFLVVALAAAFLGFGWVVDLSYPVAKAVCVAGLGLAAVSFLVAALERQKIQDAW
jgi:uncharacterized membrane protein YtjA (UPF0391 family)